MTAWSLVGIDAHREEHRTEVTEVTEGEFEVGRRKALWWTGWFPGEKDAHREEHRTEVTEVTEGNLRLDGARPLVDGLVSGEKMQREEHRTEVTEVTEGI